MTCQTDWVTKKEVQIFHDLYARRPDSSNEKRIFQEFMNDMQTCFRGKSIWQHFRCVGSSYEETNVEIEFDVMVILQGGKQLEAKKVGIPGYYKLQLKQRIPQAEIYRWSEFTNKTTFKTDRSENPIALPEKTKNAFIGDIQKFINDSRDWKESVVRKHGPAVQVDVYMNGRKQFPVDLVPTFNVDNYYYVPKQFDYEKLSEDEKEQSIPDLEDIYWRRSNALEEFNELNKLDRGNLCHKKVYRILKVIRNGDATLRQMTSYHIKNALLHVIHCNLNWKDSELASRLKDVMIKLSECYETGKLYCFCSPEIDLLKDMKKTPRENVHFRLLHLIRSRKAMLIALKMESRNESQMQCLDAGFDPIPRSFLMSDNSSEYPEYSSSSDEEYGSTLQEGSSAAVLAAVGAGVVTAGLVGLSLWNASCAETETNKRLESRNASQMRYLQSDRDPMTRRLLMSGNSSEYSGYYSSDHHRNIPLEGRRSAWQEDYSATVLGAVGVGAAAAGLLGGLMLYASYTETEKNKK